MDKKPSGFRIRWKTLYHRSSVQMILSIAFTAVAVVGMLFLGIALLLRFSSSACAVPSAQTVSASSSEVQMRVLSFRMDCLS